MNAKFEVVRIPCPECKTGRLSLITDGAIGKPFALTLATPGRRIDWRKTQAPFLACNTCEFCIEIDHHDLAVAERGAA